MEVQHLAYILALAVGITSAGLVGSAWELATGEEARLGDLLDPDPDYLTPLRAFAAILSAPRMILVDGFGWLIAQPIFGLPLIAAGLGWSFFQGVFILTQVFGLP
jgi:hypothetical protein